VGLMGGPLIRFNYGPPEVRPRKSSSCFRSTRSFSFLGKSTLKTWHDLTTSNTGRPWSGLAIDETRPFPAPTSRREWEGKSYTIDTIRYFQETTERNSCCISSSAGRFSGDPEVKD